MSLASHVLLLAVLCIFVVSVGSVPLPPPQPSGSGTPLPVPEKALTLTVESCVDASVLSVQSSREEIHKALARRVSGDAITPP